MLHAEGEVGDVVVGGVANLPGQSVWEQSRFIASDNSLRQFLLNEPRGGVFRHYNLLVPPKDPPGSYGIHNHGTSGHSSYVRFQHYMRGDRVTGNGIVPMVEPVTEMILEAPGGLVKVIAACSHGKATAITLENLPSFVVQDRANIQVEGYGSVNVTTAFGGDSFVMTNARELGFELVPGAAAELARFGIKLRAAANEQLEFTHPFLPDWKHYLLRTSWVNLNVMTQACLLRQMYV